MPTTLDFSFVPGYTQQRDSIRPTTRVVLNAQTMETLQSLQALNTSTTGSSSEYCQVACNV
jgi:hypothetical protein